MAVKTKIQPDYDVDAIVTLAGYTPADAWVVDGWLYIEGPDQPTINQATATYISGHDANLLARAKKLANDEVDKEAERARERLLRTTPGQSIVQLRKEIEAQAYLDANHPPDLTPYPFVESEVETTGFTGKKVAEAIIANSIVDKSRDTLIEKKRKKAKIEIDNQLGHIGVGVAKKNLKDELAAIDPTTDVSTLPRAFVPPEDIVSRELFLSPPQRELVQIEEPAPKEEPTEETKSISDMLDERISNYEPPAMSLEEVKEEALYTVDAYAETARQEHMAVGPVQMMVYTEKFNEATDYIVDDMPEDTSPYPFIDAEVGATGKSAEEIANSIIDKKGEWISFNAKVERVRLVAKTHILEAQTIESVDEIVKLAADTLDSMVE